MGDSSHLALLWCEIPCPRVQPRTARHMHPPKAFRIHAIQPVFLRNGVIDRLDLLDVTCASCTTRSTLGNNAGFAVNAMATVLTCPSCAAIAILDELEIWGHWLEQRRRERLLAQFDPSTH